MPLCTPDPVVPCQFNGQRFYDGASHGVFFWGGGGGEGGGLPLSPKKGGETRHHFRDTSLCSDWFRLVEFHQISFFLLTLNAFFFIGGGGGGSAHRHWDFAEMTTTLHMDWMRANPKPRLPSNPIQVLNPTAQGAQMARGYPGTEDVSAPILLLPHGPGPRRCSAATPGVVWRSPPPPLPPSPSPGTTDPLPPSPTIPVAPTHSRSSQCRANTQDPRTHGKHRT